MDSAMKTGKLVKAGPSPARWGSDCIGNVMRAQGNAGLMHASTTTIHGWCECMLLLPQVAAMGRCTPMRGGHLRAGSMLQSGD